MTVITLTQEQRDGLRQFISTEACTVAADAFPQWSSDVPADRAAVIGAVDRARAYLLLFDRIGWDIEGDADEYVLEFTDFERELILSLEDEVRNTYEYDHRADDKATLDAVLSLKAEAVA